MVAFFFRGDLGFHIGHFRLALLVHPSHVAVFQLYQHRTDGPERHVVLFELFGFDLISFSWGVGELES